VLKTFIESFYLELVPLLLDHESHFLLGRIGYLENLIREKRRRNSDALGTDSIEQELVTCKIVRVTFFFVERQVALEINRRLTLLLMMTHLQKK